jgi:hypothetical protein
MSTTNYYHQMVSSRVRPLPFFTFVSITLFVFISMWYNVHIPDAAAAAYNQLRGVGQQCQQNANPSRYISSLCNCGKEIIMAENEPPNSNGLFDWCSRESSVRGPHQKIISYALYGNAQNASVFKRYYSLLRNISLTAERDYPGWIIRIYHNIPDRNGPEREAHEQLCDVYCRFNHVDLCSVPLLIDRIGNDTTPIDPALLTGLNPRMFRYLVMLDPNVDVFISRDVDSLIWRREVDAVNEWLRSNYTFHVMRDHMNHGSVILAGIYRI